MATDHELQITAAAMAAIRPDWPAGSVLAVLRREETIRSKPYRHLIVAGAAIASDPASTTPKRLATSGPWWRAAGAALQEETPGVGPGRGVERCDHPGHEHEAAASCRACRAEMLAADEPPPAPEGAPVPPPEWVTERAEAHRRTAAQPKPEPSPFGQSQELPTGTTEAASCARCGCAWLDIEGGDEAHRVVFGHLPAEPAPAEAVAS